MTVDSETFKAAMGSFPAGVTITTTRDARGRDWGFTASAFASVSLDPPLVLVCLQNDADCFEAFMRSANFAISIVRPCHEEVAFRFATKGADKFAGDDLVEGPFRLRVVRDALAVIGCSVEERVDAGDHVILVGRVEVVESTDGEPAVFYKRRFRRLAEIGA